MTPKEKAEELIDKFINIYEEITLGIAKKHWAKQCALIAVDEIRDTLPLISDIQQYWINVKSEIEKL